MIAGASVPTASASPVNVVEVQEYNAMRRTIAKRLTESKQQVPHIYVTVEVDMEALLTVREQLNRNAGGAIPKVSVNDLIVKASACALIEVPVVNSKFDNNQRIISKSAHIGVAVSLPDGLIVPVVKNADALSVRNISRTVKQLAEKARSGKLAPSEYSGGTFTISNMGAIADVENFAAIINPGEGAILAVSGTRTVPAVVNGAIVARRRMKVTLSADHRVVDGSEFLPSLSQGVGVFAQTEKIYDTCLSILNKSENEKIPAQQAAIDVAKARIEAMGRVKLPF